VCELLTNPQKLEKDDQGLNQVDESFKNAEALKSQRVKLQHALERLIDSFTEGLIEKDQFTSRMDRTKRRIAELEAKALMSHVDEVATRIYFSLDLKAELRTPEEALLEENRRQLYFELKPLIATLAAGSGGVAGHYLFPHTAHYLLETLNGVLQYEPGDVIKFAAQTCKAASALNYQFDPMAITEVVTLVEHSLADHRGALKDPSIATALG
jgi:hypothetical protein